MIGIKDNFSKNEIIKQIRTIITDCQTKEITFLWAPSHLNIVGNEKADNLAKMSLSCPISSNYKFHITDFKRYIERFVSEQWQNIWKEQKTNKLFEIQNKINVRFSLTNFKRKDICKIVRLKIGHCLFSHKHLIEKTQPPQCICGQQLTVKHIFNSCLNLSRKRHKYNITGIQMLNNETNYEQIINFFKDITLYDSI